MIDSVSSLHGAEFLFLAKTSLGVALVSAHWTSSSCIVLEFWFTSVYLVNFTWFACFKWAKNANPPWSRYY